MEKSSTRLAVVSDSHYARQDLEKLLGLLDKEGITHLAHAGDFITNEVVALFSDFPGIQCYIAIGNCDHFGNIIAAMRQLPNVRLNSVVYFELEGKHFAVSHIEGMAEKSLEGKPVDVFIHGHTHRAKIEKQGDSLVINPGSLMEGAGFMVMELPSLRVDRRFSLS